MQISDALPYQFWPTGTPTFIEKVNAGVVSKCYCQPVNEDDETPLQFIGDEAVGFDLLVRVFGTDVLLDTLAFAPPGAPLVWEVAFAAAPYVDNIIYLQIVDHADPSTVFARTGPLDVKSDHRNTRLIKYSNDQNYAGLDYTDGEIFQLRVWSKFFKEQLPEESESESLSDGEVVKLSSSVKQQKYFEVELMPFFMHRKIKLAVLHNTINIDDELWTEEGGYETNQPDERFPYYTGKVWLTKQEESFITNVFGETTEI